MEEYLTDVEKAIDFAFMEGKFILNFYTYLRAKNARRVDAQSFLNSVTKQNIIEVVQDLDIYLEGGNSELNKLIREAYGYLPKPQARKIRNYLYGFIDDAKKYIKDKNAKSKRKPKAKATSSK
jgi:hypothetical protein